MPVHRYMKERLAGVTPDVNLGESVTCIPLPSMNKAVYYGFETQGRCHQKSKPGVSVAPQKGLISTKNLKRNKNFIAISIQVYRQSVSSL